MHNVSGHVYIYVRKASTHPPRQKKLKKLTVINFCIKFGCITLEITFKLHIRKYCGIYKALKWKITQKHSS